MSKEKRLRILFLRSNYGQPDSRCEKEMFCLSQKHDVEFLGWDRSCSFKGIKDTTVEIGNKSFVFHHIGIKAPLGQGFKRLFIPLLKFWIRELRYLNKNKKRYDVIHACDFDTGFPLMMLLHKPKIVYDIYDYYADTHSAPKIIDKSIRKLETRLIRKSDAVIICNEIRKKQILPAEPEKLYIIHNSPPDINMLSTKCTSKSSSKIRLVYVGTLSKDRFLMEMSEVISGRDDIELHIGGIGVLESYFSQISGKFSNITFYGKMSYNDVLSLEKECDIMTATYDPRIINNRYASPNKFYESLMLKKPLIMMKNTGMDTFVEEYKLGEVIDVELENFKEGFSRALDNLISKKDQWTEMGERGFKLYNEKFSWHEMEKRLLNLYDDLEIKQDGKDQV